MISYEQLKRICALAISILCCHQSLSQQTFPVNGIPDERKIYHAFTNCRVYIDFQTVIDSATLVIYDGLVYDVGKKVQLPREAVIHNMNGKTIYPSFIDPDTQYGILETTPGEKPKKPQITSTTRGAYSWNQSLKPEVQGHRMFAVNDTQAEEFRKAGFGSVLTFSHDGIARGTGALVLLSDEKEQEVIVKERAAACYSFDKGTSSQDYPTSQMGAIALIRQAYLDAEWYRNGGNKLEYNISIQAWNDNRDLPQLFESRDKFQALRIDRIGEEFGVNFIVRGSGDEYQRIKEIKATGNVFIIPLKFPSPFDVTDPYDAINISLGELKHWEMAPVNAFLLSREGIPFAFTSRDLKDPSQLLAQVRKTIEYGLSPSEALKALTYTPAGLFGVGNKLGALKKNMIANFIVASGDLFSKDQVILENWIAGKQHLIVKGNDADIRGSYDLNIAGKPQHKLNISGTQHNFKSFIRDGTDSIGAQVQFNNDIITIKYETKRDSARGSYRLSGFRMQPGKNNFSGTGNDPSGQTFTWEATATGPAIDVTKRDSVIEKPVWEPLRYPNKAFGFKKLPEKESVLFRNVTVWTNEDEGILQNTDVLISNGKISKIGRSLDTNNVIVINGNGKHLTAGIVDEHSHIAVSGNVNECSHAVTSEVRIGDVIDSDDINIYRQLAGGVTTAQLLHGSCNPIGGQAALIKLRWGRSPDEMKFEGSDSFIKFALGENVKQSNFGDIYTIRYPQTRMGVEQVYINAFQQAKEYESSIKKYNPNDKNSIKPRRDLRTEALAEILNGKRHITCHSYQQGEINMLMHVADSMGFKINTFTHILEGYKVADKMKAHGAGASSFSDWWAYKYEVIEAIPYNGSILHKMGIITAFNSDDPEMARRLNQEAAKTIRYGGISEEEAWKFVTLNPAKLLHIDDEVGSIKVGRMRMLFYGVKTHCHSRQEHW